MYENASEVLRRKNSKIAGSSTKSEAALFLTKYLQICSTTQKKKKNEMKARVWGILFRSGLGAFTRTNTSMQIINSAAAYKCPFTSVADCEVTFSRLGIFFDKNPGPIVMCAAPFALSQILNLFEFLLGIVENPVRRD